MSTYEDAEREQADRGQVEDDAGMDAEEMWYALNDGWVR